MDIARRIAAGQLAALCRERRVVPAGVLVGLVQRDTLPPLAVALDAAPGSTADPVGPAEVSRALTTLLPVFAAVAAPIIVELVEGASPGLAEALTACGLRVSARMPVLAVEPDGVHLPPTPADTTVHVTATQADYDIAGQLAAAAFGGRYRGGLLPTTPDLGGRILVRHKGNPVATAAWTAVGDGVTEIVGVGCATGFRGRGFGSLATARATLAAGTHGGGTLRWLTPIDEAAGRIYQRLGFNPVARAVHLELLTQ